MPCPTAIHKVPFHAIPHPHIENIFVPIPTQLIPLEE